MKDYSDYYTSYNEKSIGYLKIMFEKQLNSSDGETVTIDNIPNIKVIIQEHTNPLNEDKEDRKMLVSNTISIHTGSMIKIGNETWMIINKVSPLDDNGVYYTTKIYPCNAILKWISPVDKITIREVNCIKSNMSLYSIGTSENKYFVTEDGKRFITIPLNDNTKEIYVGQRFIIDNDTFKVTEIYNDNGILEIKTEQCDKLPDKDNINGNGIAYNDGINITNPPITPSYTIQIIGDDSIQSGYSKTYQAKVYNNGVEVNENVVWSIDNSISASITPNGSSCEVNGLLEGEYVTLTCKLQSNNSVLSTKSIYISGGW